ncbi:MAG: RNA methyltransferase [Syntrophomonadaceae bacterium]|nr:RNA methyltransferase [Syntrophomonadaceae bacterium]
MKKSEIYIALLHDSMYNKRMDIITTSVTNLDLHDIARAAHTFAIEKFFVVHSSSNQQELINDILDYWITGYGGTYNPDRKEAFSILSLASNLQEVKRQIEEQCGEMPITIATDARIYPNTVSYRTLKSRIKNEVRPYLILFGTGWGMEKTSMEDCDLILEPIQPLAKYNHLSVRSAVSIILDRLLGDDWYE